MNPITTLIGYLIFVGALAGGYGIWHHKVSSEGAAEQLVEDTKVYNVCVADKKTAVDANISLQNDVNLIRLDIAARNKEMLAMAEQLVAAKAKIAELQAKNKPRIDSLLTDKAEALAAAAASVARTCQDKLAVVTNALVDISKRELKDRPPTVEEVKQILQLK